MGEKRQKKRRMSMLTRQISGPLAGFIILLILLNAGFLFYHNMNRYLNMRFDSAEKLGRIVATDLAEKYGVEFFNGNLVTWFSVLFFR